jgi:hypothetical protein
MLFQSSNEAYTHGPTQLAHVFALCVQLSDSESPDAAAAAADTFRSRDYEADKHKEDDSRVVWGLPKHGCQVSTLYNSSRHTSWGQTWARF